MRNALTILMFVMGLAALPLAAVAQPDLPDEANEEAEEATLNAVDEGSTEEDLTLPEEAAEEGHTNSAFGLETANEARQSGREFGEDRAAEAREDGQGSGGIPDGTPAP